MITDLSQLDTTKTYSYADYLTWELKERVELIKGFICKMSPAPTTKHQEIVGNVFNVLYMHFKKRPCKTFVAPFDVRLNPIGETSDDKIYTTVQPDVCVICDLSKLDEKGCLGAPDLIVEVLSKTSIKRDLYEKLPLYAENGVKEYWVIDPNYETLMIHTLVDGNYTVKQLLSPLNIADSTSIEGLSINVSEIFPDADIQALLEGRVPYESEFEPLVH